jgi:hypothetical protein|tara:strand:+ start:223 stop:549 length:327 start_codon:yes stop_codon:yes gene_type:complete
MKEFFKEFFKDIKRYGYINHISSFLLTLFFIFVAKKIELQISLFGFIYWYVASLLMGHYAAHNVKPTKKWKYKKGKNDTFVALPLAGLINILTYGILILIFNYFFNIL